MLFALEQLRPDVAHKRRRWQALQPRLDPDRLVFIDETWVKTNMAPLRGWGPKGERLKAYAPHGRWRTLTFLGALRTSGFAAPCVFDGPINGEAFRAWVDQFLAPTLQPGDIVVMDNLGSHKGSKVRQMIQSAGARLWFLPAYSPDLNPIEQTFSKIKEAMRKAQQRTIDAVIGETGRIVQAISPLECRNYINGAGYASAKT
jgi:transposase